jgi:hypothetical protein
MFRRNSFLHEGHRLHYPVTVESTPHRNPSATPLDCQSSTLAQLQGLSALGQNRTLSLTVGISGWGQERTSRCKNTPPIIYANTKVTW